MGSLPRDARETLGFGHLFAWKLPIDCTGPITEGINKLKSSGDIQNELTVRFAEPDYFQKDWADTLAKQVAMSNADAPPPPPPPPACSPSYAPA